MDDPESVQILAAYFPARDNVEDADRLRWAISARNTLYPSEDHIQAEQEIKHLLEIESAEHSLLTSYWGIIILNTQSLQRAISYIDDNCKRNLNMAQRQDLWSHITLALGNCAAISRMFEASYTKAPKDSVERLLRDRRAALLKSVVGRRSEPSLYLEQIRSARNAVEHFEEYFDVWIDRSMSENKKMWDLQCLSEAEIQTSDDYFLRWFDHEKKIIHIFDLVISLDSLIGVSASLSMMTMLVTLRGRYHPEWDFALYG